jgi:uncharacterized lipoprotein YehR (DUF1307 family)
MFKGGLSKTKMRMRNLSILMGLSFLIILLSCRQKGEQEIYVLPNGYTGLVLVILNQKDGVPEKYAGKSRVYEIPETGILKTQFSNNEGWTELPQFYYDRIEKQNQISVKMDYEDISLDEVNATLVSTGVAYRNIDGTGEIKFVEFYVGTKTQIDEASRKAEKLNIGELVK